MTAGGRLVASAQQGGRLFRLLLYALDAAAIVLSTLVAYYARFEGTVPAAFAEAIPWVVGRRDRRSTSLSSRRWGSTAWFCAP